MSDQKKITSKISPLLLTSNPPGITERRRGQSESGGQRSVVESPTSPTSPTSPGTGNGNLHRTMPVNSGERRQNGRGFASFFSYGSGKRSNKNSTQLRLMDPEAGSPSILDDRGSNVAPTGTVNRDIDGDSVISGSGTRFHGYDMVGEPHSTPIAVLPKACSLESIPRELEEFAQSHKARELLIDAAFNQDDRTVKNLLVNSFRHPLSPGENFELGATLLIAAWKGQASLVQYLVTQCGADLTFTDHIGRTALHLAALAGSGDTVAVLVKAGAPVNAWDREQPVTPLCCAASVGALECVKILVEAGAAIEFGSEPSTVSALHHAVLVNAVDVVRYLVSKKANVNFGQVFSETPVHIAAAEGYVDCLKILLDNGGNVVLKGSNGMTPLHLAARDGASETVALLIQAGSDVNAPNNMDRTPLHLAALSQSLECVELLLNAGARPNAQDVDLKTPLHSAIVKAARNCDCVKTLLDAGADPNKQDNSGFTPLHLAVINEFSICVQLLLERGGDVTIKTNGGRSVLTYMVRKTPDTLGKLRDMFNQSVSLSDDVNDREVELHFNFKVLKPPSNKHEMLLFTNLIQCGQRRLLNHPLCESFLYLKWQKIRKFFWFNLVFYGLFVLTLTWYIMNVFRERCLLEECNENLNNKTDCTAECLRKGLTTPEERENFTKRLDISISWWAMVVLSFVLMAKELFQVVQNFKEYYRTLENVLQISILILVIFLVNLKYPETSLPIWKYHIAAITVFFAWVELMFLIGRFPQYGLYIQMFIIVLKDFGQFFVAYFAIIMAFSMSFAVIFFRHALFKNPLEGIISTLVMMTGEYEYSDAIFFRTDEKGEVEQLEFQGTSHALFVLFLLIMAIIMMNLLVGMAVNDIQGLQKTAKLERLVRQTELIAHIESTILSNLFSFLPRRITRFLHNSALLVPESYRWSLYIRCNDPRDKRLPRDIVEAAYKLAKCTRNVDTRYGESRMPHGPTGNLESRVLQRRRHGLDRNMPHQRSGFSQQGPPAPEASVWTEESHEHIEQIKQMLSILQLDKEYLERKVEETEEAVTQLKNQLIPLVTEVLQVLQLHRRRSAIRRRSRPRHSDEDDDDGTNNEAMASRPHSVATTAPVENSTLSSQSSSSSVPLDLLRHPVVDSSPENSTVH